MGIDIGGCNLILFMGLLIDPNDADGAWQWWLEFLIRNGWDGHSTI